MHPYVGWIQLYVSPFQEWFFFALLLFPENNTSVYRRPALKLVMADMSRRGFYDFSSVRNFSVNIFAGISLNRSKMTY